MVRRFSEDFESLDAEVEEIIDAENDRVVAVIRSSGLGKRSGPPVEMRTANVFWLAGRRIVRIDPYLDPDEALEAVGLRGRHRDG